MTAVTHEGVAWSPENVLYIDLGGGYGGGYIHISMFVELILMCSVQQKEGLLECG